ncbi:hypothetical protein SODALDRAFT_328662 [Sodiomyces alkalinus F11]|uniref:Fungal N-terminal domain-containing protein n=1 Tax=Sodiomyces alkalinus (strain CBS 110278 / VKM F-3762 / F11) TaxID=1314773 RepID=A0A3N2PLD8_SODAK|nr:hypothetical protein SODALDRAFT_328662 [Sodiomyces alkalinus F11]ROT35337.1 hypothetical protein SODALDRAFT_328662 [Sodiomyces alkalinus F11]
MPGFSSIDSIELAAAVLQFVEFAAKTATALRALRTDRQEIRQLTLTLSRVSLVLSEMSVVARTSMSGATQHLALELFRDSEEALGVAMSLIGKLESSSFKRAKWVWLKGRVVDATRELERVDGKFLLVLQMHHFEVLGQTSGQIDSIRSQMDLTLESLGSLRSVVRTS